MKNILRAFTMAVAGLPLFVGVAEASHPSLNITGGTSVNYTSGNNAAYMYAVLGEASPQDSNNSLIVANTNTYFLITMGQAELVVGYYGSSNSVMISNGGTVSDHVGYLGFSTSSSNNYVLVTGGGSLWSNSGTTYVGYNGGGTLTVANGATLRAGGIALASSNGSTGTLNIGSPGGTDTAGALISPTITFGSGSGTINFNQIDTATITNQITGSGSVNQLGSGTTILSASNSFNGQTIVNAGTLLISTSGSLSGSGNTTVNFEGILQNNGAISGSTSISGTLSGNGGNFDNLTLNGGAASILHVNNFTGTSGTGWDVLTATNLDLTNLSSTNPFTLNIAGASGMGDGSSSYTLDFLDVTGSLTGFSSNNFTVNSSLFTADPSLAGGSWAIGTNMVSGVTELQATYTVPEPSTYALLGLGALVMVIAARRRAS